MEEVKAIFSGGPANGKQMIIDGSLEYVFYIRPEGDWFSGFATIADEPASDRLARYRRTYFQQNEMTIYEFEGIEQGH